MKHAGCRSRLSPGAAAPPRHCTHTQTHTHTPTRMSTHAHRHAHTCKHRYTHKQTYLHTHAEHPPNAYTCARTHPHAAHTHTHPHAAHTHTGTHTHTQHTPTQAHTPTRSTHMRTPTFCRYNSPLLITERNLKLLSCTHIWKAPSSTSRALRVIWGHGCPRPGRASGAEVGRGRPPGWPGAL